MALGEWIVVGGTAAVTAAGVISYRILKRKGAQIFIGGGTPETIAAPTTINARTVMMIAVSILVLCSSLFVILSKQYDGESQKWAFGVIGTILGFWLRPEEK
ncbi:hypothetical protein E0E52_14555 [Azotobacter chroococcum]|uniref:hypothetical protein n=1 Tax=Azotobacter chroococcum TaxID=353 RepID=UPI00103B0E47|nr:hypothetical protein [Azotobacter chroococcum]TBW03654.1 hypothetical protein E0E52_14555 [Azotobacter chroococcum]